MTSTCKYLLQTTDTPPAFITVATRGQHNPCTKEVEALLSYPNRAGEICDSAAKLRFFVSMETGDARYAEKVNAGMWVGIGAMKGTNEIIYE